MLEGSGKGGETTTDISRCDVGLAEGGDLTSARRGSVSRLLLRLAVPLCLVVLVLLVYMPALNAGLVDWDDDDLLLYNQRYHTLADGNLWWMFTTSFSGHFQPLTWLSYWLDWQIWQRESFGYHLTNVLLHALTTLGFYALIRSLWGFTGVANGRPRSPTVLLSAGAAAALFSVHPLRVESVAWLAERRDVLSAMLYVLSVLCYLRYVRSSTPDGPLRAPRAPWRAYLAAVAFCGLSLLAKASAVTLPVVLLILDVYPLRRLRGLARTTGRPMGELSAESAGESGFSIPGRGGLGRTQAVSAGRTLLEKLPFLVLAVAAGARAIVAQRDGGALYTLAEHGLLARMAQASYGLVFYAIKTVWPVNLGPIYEIPPREVLLGPRLWMCVGGLVVAGLVTFRARRRFPATLAAVAVYVVLLMPVLGFLQSGPQFVADRYSYLSCMGLTMLAGTGLLLILRGRIGRNSNARAITALVVVATVTWLANTTSRQSEHWKSARALWSHAVKVSPDSAIAHTNYADVLARDEQVAAAVPHYRRALKLNPRDVVALHHLGNLHRQFGQLDNAADLYRRALQIDPDRRGAGFSLGRILVDADRVGAGLIVLRDVVSRHPEALDEADYLAQLLSTHPDEKIRDADEAIALSLRVNRANGFGHPPALLTLATAYAGAGRFDQAIETVERALVLVSAVGNPYLAAELQRRLDLFRAGTPFHFDE